VIKGQGEIEASDNNARQINGLMRARNCLFINAMIFQIITLSPTSLVALTTYSFFWLLALSDSKISTNKPTVTCRGQILDLTKATAQVREEGNGCTSCIRFFILPD
jgi:hypothetical protein